MNRLLAYLCLMFFMGTFAIEVKDNNGVSLYSTKDSRKRVKIVESFFKYSSPYPDQWTLVELDDCLLPTDAIERVLRCDNEKGTSTAKCVYEHHVGTSKKQSQFSSKYISQKATIDVQRIFRSPKHSEYTSGHSWSQSSESVFEEDRTSTITIDVPAGHVIDITQIVGYCGAFVVRTENYKIKEYGYGEQIEEPVLGERYDGKQRKAFWAVDGSLTVDAAKSACAYVDEGTLASPRTETEHAAVNRLCGAWAKNNDIFAWIGAMRQYDKGPFFWMRDPSFMASPSNGGNPPTVDGVNYTAHWDKSQPDNNKGQEFYIALKNTDGGKDLRWHDVNNGYRLNALCEIIF